MGSGVLVSIFGCLKRNIPLGTGGLASGSSRGPSREGTCGSFGKSPWEGSIIGHAACRRERIPVRDLWQLVGRYSGERRAWAASSTCLWQARLAPCTILCTGNLFRADWLGGYPCASAREASMVCWTVRTTGGNWVATSALHQTTSREPFHNLFVCGNVVCKHDTWLILRRA